MMERRFRRDVASLEAIWAFVNEFLASESIDPEHSFEVVLLIEELFTNMIKYQRDGRHDVAVGLERNGPLVTIVLQDFDVEPFDVTREHAGAGPEPARGHRGGRGLDMVRRIADSVRYDYRDRNSTITLTKRVAP